MSFRDTYQVKHDEFIDLHLDRAKKQSPKKDEDEVKSTFREQSKKISQLIAKSWLPEGQDIKNTLLHGSSDDIKKLLKKNDVDIDAFFGTLKINVDWNTFYGSIKEVSDPDFDGVYNMPYPPRPGEVTDDQLIQWVNDTDPNTAYPNAPYIPLSGF